MKELILKRNILGLFIFSISLLLLFGNSRAEEFSFVFITDIHLSHEGDTDEVVLKRADVLNQALKNKAKDDTVKFFITGGDHEDVEKVKSARPKKFYDQANNIYNWFPVAGNHDLITADKCNYIKDDSNYNTKALIDYMKKLMEKEQDNNILKNISKGVPGRSKLKGYVYEGQEDCARYPTYSFDYYNSHFIILDLYPVDGCGYLQWGIMDDALKDWLENDAFTTQNAYINAAFLGLGSGMTIVNDIFDTGYNTATGSQIAVDPFTAGVSTFTYGAPSQVSLVSGSTNLFFGTQGQPFVAYESTSVPDASVMLLLGSSLMGLTVFSRKSKRS